MRTTTTLGITALLLALVVGAWVMAHGSLSQGQASKAGAIDPVEMMKKTKDLPVHDVIDAN